MTFHDWIYSAYPENSVINGRWGTLHIITVILCVIAIVLIALLNKKSLKFRQNVIVILASLILLFEITRRCVTFQKVIMASITCLSCFCRGRGVPFPAGRLCLHR